jgi:GrpB-like predicted nucleotidyltransferase (UPF0157 family)
MNKKENRMHLHLIHTKKEFQNVILFRDYLLTHPEALRQYASVKRHAARMAKGDMNVYKTMKKPFIENIIRKCR